VSSRRLAAVCRFDLKENLKRPLLWIWLVLSLLTSMVMAAGVFRISSGEDMAGGIQAHITSQFGNAYEMSLFVAVLFPLFVAVVAGMGVLRDGELRIEQLLHSTPLSPSEYVWGKFAAALATSFATLLAMVCGLMLFKHGMTGADKPELVGAFSLANYLVPMLGLSAPLIILVAGVTFAIGERTRNAVLVNMVPLVILLGCVFFLWTWSPNWLDPGWNRILMLLDPTGFRWVSESWLKVDRGAEFYNTAKIVFDPAFVASRIALVVVGLAAVVWSKRHLAEALRGEKVSSGEVNRALSKPGAGYGRAAWRSLPLADLQMSSCSRGFLKDTLEIARVESLVLARHPAMWILIPLVVLNATIDAIYATGSLDTPLLLTPGVSAVGSLVELTFALCLLLMFYTVESLRREQSTRLDAIAFATPPRTSSLILGKAIANGLVGAVTLLAVFATCAVLLLRQGTVPLDPWPYVVVYGFLVGPIVVFVTALVGLIYSLTGNRLTTYAVAIAVMMSGGILVALNKMSWVWNWSLSGALRWSDMAPFELNRTPLILNRVLVLAVGMLLLVVAIRVFPRRRFDAARIVERLRPGSLVRTALRLSPLLLLPLVLGVTLHKGINRGSQGARIERWTKLYWQRNHATWLDAAVPDIAHSDIDLELEPERRWFRTNGSYDLVNRTGEVLSRIAITGGPHWEDLSWSLDGAVWEPENREGLYLFELPEALPPGGSCSIGFEFEGVFLPGFSKNGEGSHEFIVPSGVVLTATSPSFLPLVGYQEWLGVGKDNQYDAREYPEDFFEGVTPAAFGPDAPHTSRVRITAPESYTMNSVGVLTESVVHDGKRTVTWESDYPVDTFNVVGGRWSVRRGDGASIFHHPEHSYNIDEMMEALEGAREYYSKWFYPYPWRELKLSEFPAEANYAQGFVTNITFSESMGFLAKPDPRVDAPFLVTAHEAAHQWWGGLLMPGDGPNGIILSEGMAHFSTMLLFEQLRGPEQRGEFCKWTERRYNNRRVINSERELVKIDGSRDGDATVIYDKGSWVFWMLHNLMGRERNLAGITSFIEHYIEDPDHPVLQDFVAHLRPFAPDAEAYDRFVDQWFFDLVMPEYTVHTATRLPGADHDGSFDVDFSVQNVGTGRMSVEVSAERGQRFAGGDFHQARAAVELGAGESRQVSIRCDFEPERIVVDPDVRVLQRGRSSAIYRF
jgi:ABC-type transport system involved in multi-copper enzyme maturation permease subunit